MSPVAQSTMLSPVVVCGNNVVPCGNRLTVAEPNQKTPPANPTVRMNRTL